MISRRAQLSEQLQTIAIGQPEIQDCRIVGGVRQRFPRVSSQADGVYDEFGPFQRSFDELRNSRLIFNDQKTHVPALSENCRVTSG